MPPNPPTKRVVSPRAALREAPCKYPHFYKNILNPPPPRNEILDTPLVELLILSLPVQLCEFVIMDRYCIVVALSISLELKVDSVALLS